MDTTPHGRVAIAAVAWAGCALAVTGLVMEFLAGFGYGHGWWGLRVALRYLFAYGGIVAAVGCALALVGFLLARAGRAPGAVPAGLGVGGGRVPGRLVLDQYQAARRRPALHRHLHALHPHPP